MIMSKRNYFYLVTNYHVLKKVKTKHCKSNLSFCVLKLNKNLKILKN